LNEGDRVKIYIIDVDEKKKTMLASMLDRDVDSYPNDFANEELMRKGKESNTEQQSKNKQETCSPETKMTKELPPTKQETTNQTVEDTKESKESKSKEMKKSEKPEEVPNSEDLGIDENSNPNIKEKSIFPRFRKQVMKDKKPITQQMLFMRRQE